MLANMSDPPGPAIEELLRANREFYRAFAAGDFVAMDRLWSDHLELWCMHPGRELLRGRDRVMSSWHGILRRPAQVRCRDAVVELLGETGVVACVEVLPGVELTATNVFVREQGRWRMFHHQAGLMAPRRERDEDDDDEMDDDGDDNGGRLLN